MTTLINPDRSKALWFDDTTPSIEYSGAWDPIPWEGGYQSTIHSTTEVGASASFSFPGPAYAFINITWPACQGSGYSLRAYVHGLDDQVGPVGLNCGTRNNIDLLELYWNIVDKPGTQKMTVEFVNGGSGDVPLLLDSFGYLPMESIGVTASPSTTVASESMGMTRIFVTSKTPTVTPSTSASSEAQVVTPAPASNTSISPIITIADPQTNNHKTPSPMIIAICVALGLGFLTVISLFTWRHRIRGLIQRLRRPQESSTPSRWNMVEKGRASTSLDLDHNTLQTLRSKSGLTDSESTVDRPRSINSLFDDSESAKSTSTITTSCILGQNPKFGQCFCPTCDETRSSHAPGSISHLTQAGRPASSGAHSDARTSITAVGTTASYRASSAGSHTVTSMYSNPFLDHRRTLSIDVTPGAGSASGNPFGED